MMVQIVILYSGINNSAQKVLNKEKAMQKVEDLVFEFINNRKKLDSAIKARLISNVIVPNGHNIDFTIGSEDLTAFFSNLIPHTARTEEQIEKGIAYFEGERDAHFMQ